MELYIDYYQSVLEAEQPELLKEKGSKFYGYAIPVSNEQEVKLALERIKKRALCSETLVLCLSSWSQGRGISRK
jgi:putative IMPACT (imprinted ancient) family translation regulator